MTDKDLRVRLANAEQHLAVLRNRQAMLKEQYFANEREIAEVATRVVNLRDQLEKAKWAVR